MKALVAVKRVIDYTVKVLNPQSHQFTNFFRIGQS